MNEIIKKHITSFEKEEQDLTKRIKNLVIKCLEDNYLLFEKLEQNKEYHIWDVYPTCAVTFEGLDEILKIEKDITNYEGEEIINYNIYGKSGIIVRSGFTDIDLKEELLKAFKDNLIAQEIIEYIYSGNTFDIYEHKSWKNCIKDYKKEK